MSGHDATASQLASYLIEHDLRVAVAESCTGGLLAGALTSLPGSSQWFQAGLVTYQLDAKTRMLGVPAELLAEQGAVNETVARQMAQGALAATGADLAIATTGLAGPDGDGTEVPVGTLWIGWARAGGWTDAERFEIHEPRASFREDAVELAIKGLLDRLEQATAVNNPS